MADHRAVGHRGPVRAADVPRRLSIDCDTCGAATGTRCFRMSSWRDVPDHPQGGFYTERIDTPHNTRRQVGRHRPPLSDRGALRREISRLAGLKMGGTDRMRTRTWANSSRRTDDELAEKIAALSKLPDMPGRSRIPRQR